MPQHDGDSGVLASLIRGYTERGVEVPPDLLARIESRLAPCALADLEPGRPAARLVKAWQATRSAPRAEDEVWIILLRMFQERFSHFTPGLKEALREQHMGVFPTRIEVGLQLGSRCFHLGRRMIAQDAESRPGRFLLDECVTTLTTAAQTENRLPDHKRKQYRGQLATALTILARRASVDEVVPLLRAAEEHSRIAEELGDRTEQHFAYRGEIGLRLYNATRDDTHLESALRSLTAVANVHTKRLCAVKADMVAELGYTRIERRELADGIALLREAEAGYGAALELDATDGVTDVVGDSVDDGYLLAKRAQLRNWLYRVAVDSHGRRNTRLLESALADWLDERASAHSHSATVATALLDMARIRLRRDDPIGAAVDRERARALLPPGSSQAEMKLRATELEHAISEAITSDDLVALRQLIEEVTGLPPEAVIPSAALARACKVMAMATGGEEWRSLVALALDRVEMDVAHPAVSPPAARAIAGHAALLAWLLARRTNDRELLGRTIQLYRTSFDAVDLLPSVDALTNVGTCALALGKVLLSGDETDAEDAAGLFSDGVSWMSTALSRAIATPSAVRDDFEPMIAHSRLGEMALRAYPLTWDADLLDTAIEHLEASRGLGQDAMELIGLLGDAYYRRGNRHRSHEDLKRAIGLKDEAFAAGSAHRENRSLAAAAAVRLYRLCDEPQLLTDAVGRALQAVLCDPSWPWAVIQLADLANMSTLLDGDKLASAQPEDLRDWALAGRRAQLLERAAELAVRTEEFSASILGGQQRLGERGVRVLNDPHRLLEHAIVLKRLDHDAAHRERDDTLRFTEWLSSVSAPPGWVLPEPLAVVDLPGGDSVYVMRRSQGRVLGASVVGWHTARGDDPRPRFHEALRYLAAYQAWRVTSNSQYPRLSGAAERTALDRQVEKASRKLGLSDEVRNRLAAALRRFADDGMPVVAKKDPHPGNWLWTHRNELVLIDIESAVALPLLQEVVTVLDDLPLLDLTPEGWTERHTLCRNYIEALQEFGLPTVDQQFPFMECYEAMATLHAAKGLGRLRHADPGISSYSVGAQRLQEAHYRDLLEYMRLSGTRSDVRELASALINATSRHGHPH